MDCLGPQLQTPESGNHLLGMIALVTKERKIVRNFNVYCRSLDFEVKFCSVSTGYIIVSDILGQKQVLLSSDGFIVSEPTPANNR